MNSQNLTVSNIIHWVVFRLGAQWKWLVGPSGDRIIILVSPSIF